jgi:hypothetical protein
VLEQPYFAAPGLADWYLGRRGEGAPVRLPAKARMLRGTSGPWVELTVACGETVVAARMHDIARASPRGQWTAMAAVPFGGRCSTSVPL